VSLVPLTFFEIVLGIDNVIFISILAGKIPGDQQGKARTIGLALALVTRILLFLSIKWFMELTKSLATIFSHAFTWMDLGREGEAPSEPGGARRPRATGDSPVIFLLFLIRPDSRTSLSVARWV
jgi:integral membrane protein TerC family protein